MDSFKEKEYRFPIGEAKKEEGLINISRAVQEKKVRYDPSFTACILEQMRFLPGTYWVLWGVMLLAALWLVMFLNGHGAGQEAIPVCSVFMVVAGNICFSGVARLFSYQMEELEQTLYLNLKQMVCIQMLLAGSLDLVILSVLVLVTGSQHDVGVGAWLLYMLVPFLWSDIFYLHMLTAIRGTAFSGIARGGRQLAVGVICGILTVIPALFEESYNISGLPVWGVLAVVGLCVLVLEIRRLLGNVEGGEGLCLS